MQKPEAPAAAKSPTKVQLTPEDWIKAAETVLVDKSIDAVRVDSLSKDLGVTRGSFYWHYKDREDLLRQLLLAWRDRATEQIIDRFERRNSKPRDLIRDLLMLPYHGETARRGASTELAIRAWARRDEMARHYVDEVDAKRMAYIAQCFSALGFDIPESRTRAFMLYGCMTAASLLTDGSGQGGAPERQQALERLLLAPVADAP